jgi:hypothetical protein
MVERRLSRLNSEAGVLRHFEEPLVFEATNGLSDVPPSTRWDEVLDAIGHELPVFPEARTRSAMG